ncbi:MAG: MBL fold metallo-hydrolase [Rickettsiales bacterium]|jgi:glyoxylase-like metal-dependent hydrolase (beta-lactamase superfamily II)|nr:MBL fold metallo-hydrolase [Rickettsiales bacterium]
MKYQVIKAGELGTNSVIVWDGNGAVVFDPVGDSSEWIEFFENFEVPIKAIYITHGHYDHIEAVEDLRSHFNVPWYIHADDMELVRHANHFGNVIKIPSNPSYYKEGDWDFTSSIKGQIFHTAGHSQGSCLFYFPNANLLITGDTLFKGTIGATHFPFSSPDDMEKSLKKIKALNIPEDAVIVPGHGDLTTFGEELESNYYLK